MHFCERSESVYNRKLEGTDHAKSCWLKLFSETFSIQMGLCFNFLTCWEVCKPGIRLLFHLRQRAGTRAIARGNTRLSATPAALAPMLLLQI